VELYKLGPKIGVPQKIFRESQNSKFGLKFSVCMPITLGGATSQNVPIWGRHDNLGSFFGGPAP